MTKFVISAVLDENKNLTLQTLPNQNQGENRATEIRVEMSEKLAENTEFFLEFLCPKNKRYISPKLIKAELPQASGVVFCCDVPSCVLQEEGYVQIQLVARDVTDNRVVYKSNYSNKTSFFVHPSVNATETYEADDYYVKANTALSETLELIREFENGKYLQATEQTLTEEEKQQSRVNIGAGTSDFSGSYEDLTDKPEIVDPATVVKMTAQTLTEEEKLQVRTNIGAGTSDFGGSYDDLTDKPSVVLTAEQSLSEEEKQQARANIGAGTSNFSGNYEDLTNKPSFDGTMEVVDVVKTTEQTLTESEKQQARTNIGAGTSDFSGSYNDLTDKPEMVDPATVVKTTAQTLTDEEKQLARANVGAGTSDFSGSYDDLTDKPVLCNPNILINGDFRINQRNQSQYQSKYSAVAYSVDRWALIDFGSARATLDTASKTVTVPSTNDCQLRYYLEDKDSELLAGKQLALSCNINGQTASTAFTMPDVVDSSSGAYSECVQGNNFSLQMLHENKKVYVAIVLSAGSTAALGWVKLEIGNATPFTPRRYCEELSLCQRYYQEPRVNCVGICDEMGEQINLGVPISAPMRSSYSIRSKGNLLARQIDSPMSSNSSLVYGQKVHDNTATFDLDGNYVAYKGYQVTGYITIDAEIY